MSDEESRAAAFAERLRAAHRRVPSLDVPDDEKAVLVGRLIALTDASKHDVDRAAQRLDRLLADLDAGRPVADEPG